LRRLGGHERGNEEERKGIPVIARGDEARTLFVSLTVLGRLYDKLERVLHVGRVRAVGVDKRRELLNDKE